jgi:hypothetical protein
VVEAVAEGVKFSSLEHLLETHISRMAVLRPRISRQELLETLAAVFMHVGLPYDFDFDFTDPSKLTCTELISRVLAGKGEIQFEMARVRGRWAVTADDIARHAISEPAATFEVVALAHQAPDQSDWAATLVTGADARLALHRLIESPPVDPTDPANP